MIVLTTLRALGYAIIATTNNLNEHQQYFHVTADAGMLNFINIIPGLAGFKWWINIRTNCVANDCARNVNELRYLIGKRALRIITVIWNLRIILLICAQTHGLAICDNVCIVPSLRISRLLTFSAAPRERWLKFGMLVGLYDNPYHCLATYKISDRSVDRCLHDRATSKQTRRQRCTSELSVHLPMRLILRKNRNSRKYRHINDQSLFLFRAHSLIQRDE